VRHSVEAGVGAVRVVDVIDVKRDQNAVGGPLDACASTLDRGDRISPPTARVATLPKLQSLMTRSSTASGCATTAECAAFFQERGLYSSVTFRTVRWAIRLVFAHPIVLSTSAQLQKASRRPAATNAAGRFRHACQQPATRALRVVDDSAIHEQRRA
jgi:hypothetical protein